MKFLALLHIALLTAATTTFAFPTAEPPTSPPQVPSRRSRPSSSLPNLFPCDSNANPPTVTYTQNWAGAVLTGAGYRTVAATITVPPVRLPPGSNSDVLHGVSAWVGIDGAHACPDAILQAGVDMYMNHSIPRYWAWFQWSPHHSTSLTDFAIRPNDAVTLNVTAAPSLLAATFSVTNHRTGQTDSGTLTSSSETPLICGFSAEWIVEDLWAGGGGVPLVDFGTIAFTETRFATDGGVTGGVAGAAMEGVREKEGAQVVIECGKVGGDGVSCDYKGGSSP